MKSFDVRRAGQDQEMQRRIDGVVNRNSIKAGRHVCWGETRIIETKDAVGVDPWRDAFSGDQEWWRAFGDIFAANLKRQGRLKDRQVSFGRSYAADSADWETNRLQLAKVVGLRHYFDNLRPNEPVNLPCVLTLLTGIENGG